MTLVAPQHLPGGPNWRHPLSDLIVLAPLGFFDSLVMPARTQTSFANAMRMVRLLSIALMLASGSSFAPSLKTQLAARRPPPTPARAMPPDMAFQSPFEWRKNNDERRLVCPHPLSVPFLDSCTRSLKAAPLAPLARAAPDMHDNPLPLHDNPRPPGSPPLSFVCPPPTQASPRHLPSPPASRRGR